VAPDEALVIFHEELQAVAVMSNMLNWLFPSCCLDGLSRSEEEQLLNINDELTSDAAAEEYLGYRSPLEPPRSFGHKLFTISTSAAHASSGLSSASSDRSASLAKLDTETPYYVELWTRARYDGTLDDEGRFHNHGKYQFADGRCYDGDFVHGHMQGIGRFAWPVGENGGANGGDFSPKNANSMELSPYLKYAIFDGTFEQDKPVNGVLTLPDGTVIEGDVREARGGLLKPPKFTPGTRRRDSASRASKKRGSGPFLIPR
jgi:hypothetical protein